MRNYKIQQSEYHLYLYYRRSHEEHLNYGNIDPLRYEAPLNLLKQKCYYVQSMSKISIVPPACLEGFPKESTNFII